MIENGFILLIERITLTSQKQLEIYIDCGRKICEKSCK